MTKSAFDKIKAGLDYSIAFAQGDESRAVVHVPETIDVRAIRKATRLTQPAFAKRFGFNVASVRDWEQGRVQPTGPVRAYLLVIHKEPEVVMRVLSAA